MVDSIIENKLITDVAKNFIDNFFCYAESNNILDINGINSYWEKIDTSVLSQESMFIKSDKFSDEKEWRLVINDDLDKTRNEWDKQYNWKGEDNLTEFEKLIPNSLEYRYTKNNIISYMDLNFSDYIEDDLIAEIVIGPKSKIEEADIFQVLLHYLNESINMENVLIKKSSISLQ